MKQKEAEKEELEKFQEAGNDDGGAASSSAGPLTMDTGLMQPTTPEVTFQEVPSPRQHHETRPHDEAVEDESSLKKARTEDSKKPRLSRMMEEQEASVRRVPFGGEDYYTLDNYDTDFNEDAIDIEDELWAGEDDIHFKAEDGIPEALWRDQDGKNAPPEAEEYIGRLADKVEMGRLLSVGMLSKDFANQQCSGSLTTRFVYDWRLKDYGVHPTSASPSASPSEPLSTTTKRWLRRSRLVLASLDIKDAFLQVPQTNPVMVRLADEQYIPQKNLPGQRKGARDWFWFLRKFLEENLKFTFSAEQPCLERTEEAVIMIHVDDIPEKEFVAKLKGKFAVSYSMLGQPGSQISFLKRTMVMLEAAHSRYPGTEDHRLLRREVWPSKSTVCANGLEHPDEGQLPTFELERWSSFQVSDSPIALPGQGSTRPHLWGQGASQLHG